MMSLSVADWMTIVQLIYRINCIDDIAQYQKQTLELLNLTIDYSSAVFCMAELDNHLVKVKNIENINISDQDMSFLKNFLTNSSFITGICLDISGSVTRGPVMSHINIYECSAIIPTELSHALCIVLSFKDTLLGYIILWRKPGDEGFITRDMCVLGTLRNHIALQLFKLQQTQYELADGKHELEKMLLKFHLSKREIEVLYHITNGISDEQICDSLFISASTFKKHLNHIYEKMNVNSRVKLLKLVDESKKKHR